MCPTSHSILGGLELYYSKGRRSPWLALTEHQVEVGALEGWDMAVMCRKHP